MVKAYVFNSESGSFVPNPEISSDQSDRLSQDSEIDAATLDEIDQDSEQDDTPGGTGVGMLLPPDTFTIEQTVKNNPDGSTTVDVVVVIQDEKNLQYEVRVSRV